ncbi:MAG: hypothetical protein KGD67_11950 [Candidatus Lokiarchaeota archaeon]|nr:hypothetical protein [Candidatus Lokiarchaeota archaeon]
MEIKDVKKEKKKDFICSVRVSKEQSEFMKKEDITMEFIFNRIGNGSRMHHLLSFYNIFLKE